jgi:hypothetical protein
MVLAAVVIAGAVLLVHRSVTKPWTLLAGSNPRQRARIEAIVGQLRKESLRDSIDLLTSDQFYHFPSYQDPRKGYQADLEEMLSNRRCVKVMAELAALAKEEREAVCRTSFQTVFQRHKDGFERALAHMEDPTAPENPQSLRATKLGLCAIMLSEADFGDYNTLNEQIVSLLKFRDTLESERKQKGASFPSLFSLVIQTYAVPDRRFLLNLALTRFDKAAKERLRKRHRLETLSIPVVPWDAATTWFDFPYRHEGEPLDTSKGVRSYSFENFRGDQFYDFAAQDKIIEDAFREARFGKRG